MIHSQNIRLSSDLSCRLSFGLTRMKIINAAVMINVNVIELYAIKSFILLCCVSEYVSRSRMVIPTSISVSVISLAIS